MKVIRFLLCTGLLTPLAVGSRAQSVYLSGRAIYLRPNPAPSRNKAVGKILEGVASHYGEPFRGKPTHTDEIFDPDKLTAACNVIPLKTWVIVTNLRNHRKVALWVNDRMAAKNKRLIDVSDQASKELGFYSRGLTKVRVEVVTSERARSFQDSVIARSGRGKNKSAKTQAKGKPDN